MTVPLRYVTFLHVCPVLSSMEKEKKRRNEEEMIVK